MAEGNRNTASDDSNKSTLLPPIKIGDWVRINRPDSLLHGFPAKVLEFNPAGSWRLPNGSVTEWADNFRLAIYDKNQVCVSQWLCATRFDFTGVRHE